MSVLINAIGDYQVLRIDPAPQGPRKVTAIESSAGVDGHSYWLLGEKGEPAQYRTVVDLPSIGAAMVVFRGYQSLIGTRVPLQYAGLDPITDWEYQVVDVRQVEITPTLQRVGGVTGSGTGGALLIAEWILVPEITVTEEAEA
jgi:hypothetical protein